MTAKSQSRCDELKYDKEVAVALHHLIIFRGTKVHFRYLQLPRI